MLDRSRLGRLELQKQNQEDVLRRILPSLAEGLTMRHSPDLRVGSYMVLTVLCSKTNLSEELFAAVMDMVVQEWNDVTHAGLICLVVLAQQKQTVALPKKVFKALIAIEHLADDLVLLSRSYKVEKLALGLILGLVKRLGKAGATDQLRLIRLLLEANLMQSQLVAAALTPMLRLLRNTASIPGPKVDSDTQGALSDLILCLGESKPVGVVIQAALEDMDVETQQIGLDIMRKHGIPTNTPGTSGDDVEMYGVEDTSNATPFEDLVRRIPAQTAFEMSLLSHSESYIFTSLLDAFLGAYQSEKDLDAFTELSVLRKSLALTEPFFVTFFIRVWCGHYPIAARLAAIRALSKYFSIERLVADVQVLFPYILHALAESSPLIRRAATQLIVVLDASYNAVSTHGSDSPKLPILGRGQIYGQGEQSDGIAWLPWQAVLHLLQNWLVPHLEEFQLHGDQIGLSVVNNVSGESERRETKSNHQRSKKPLRATILAWLCNHVVNTPMYALKARLLPILTRVANFDQTATITLLNPILAATITYGQSGIEKKCEIEHLDLPRYIDSVMDIVTPDNKESIKLLQDMISNHHTTAGPLLLIAAFRRLRNLWPLFRQQMQVTLGRTMLDLAVGNLRSPLDKLKQREALDTLRTMRLSTETLQSFLQDCPRLSDSESRRSAKRRRTASPPEGLGDDIKKISLVLETVEASVTETHFPLLGSLSKVMADLQGYKQHTGIELHYLELLTMNSMRGILEHSAVCSESPPWQRRTR